VFSRSGLALDAMTLCEAFQQTAVQHADRTALRTPANTFSATWHEYARRVDGVAAGLAGAGVRRGDTVALMLTNRPEAVIVDTAAMHLGAVPFSIYNTSSSQQIEYLLRHARCRLIITEERFAAAVEPLANGHVIVIDGESGLDELESKAASRLDLEAAWRSIAPDDVATLIYTSGTTGPPKAVELTHSNLLWQTRLVDRVLPLRAGGRTLSYLPMAHVADRCATHYAALVAGLEVTFVADPAQVPAALAEVRPTTWGAVPRVWEKLKAGLEARFDRETAETVADAIAAVRAEQAGQAPGSALRKARERGEQTIFGALRAQLGLDELDHAISGAAPIASEVLEFFAAIGIPICEGWGMSELSFIATLNPPDAIRIGTVGMALPGMELVVAPDGELLIRGPTLMRGYRDDARQTAESLEPDGWLRTGDIGLIDDDGYVRIVDRKKELIINAAGKNMSPSNIENTLKAACQLIGTAVAIGDRRPYITALLLLDPPAVASFAETHGLESASATEPMVRAAVDAGVRRANERLSRVEQIKRYTVLPGEWEPGGDELTPTMKLKRHPIAQKYAAEIEAMYAQSRRSSAG
jgi:long-chain acyl-CoA synthetase